MAKLIKLLTKPKKHLLKKTFDMLGTNRILSLTSMTLNKHRSEVLTAQMLEAKKLLKAFYVQKNELMHASFARGIDRSEKHLISDAIVNLSRFQENLTKEAWAIEQLAGKIADNITGKTGGTPQPVCGELIRQGLATTVLMTIVVPKENMLETATLFDKIKSAVGTCIELKACNKATSAQINLAILDNTYCLDINHANLADILSRACERMRR